MLLTFYLIITNFLHGFKLLAKSAADYLFFLHKRNKQQSYNIQEITSRQFIYQLSARKCAFK